MYGISCRYNKPKDHNVLVELNRKVVFQLDRISVDELHEMQNISVYTQNESSLALPSTLLTQQSTSVFICNNNRPTINMSS